MRGSGLACAVLAWVVVAGSLAAPASAQTTTVGATVSTVAAGNYVTVVWSDIATPRGADWIGLYRAGTTDGTENRIRLTYTTGTASGSLSFVMSPFDAPGAYDFRLFSDNSLNRLAISPVLTITAPNVSVVAAETAIEADRHLSVSWSGHNTPDGSDWIGLFAVGVPNDGPRVTWTYTGGGVAGTIRLPVLPNVGPGQFEFRMFYANSLLLLGRSAPITIGRPRLAVTSSLTSFSADRAITVAWSGAHTFADGGDWISLFAVGVPNDGPRTDWTYTGGAANGSLSFGIRPNVPPGSYEFRMFWANSLTELGRSAAITIGAPTVPLSATPSSWGPGDVVQVSWSAHLYQNGGDWIGLYPAAADDGTNNRITWRYTTGASAGTVDFGIPAGLSPGGRYELRMFWANGLQRLGAVGQRTNTAPVVAAGADAVAFVGSDFSRSGSFADPDERQTWLATVDFGDGTGEGRLALQADRSFVLDHRYRAAGTFTVTVVVRDNAGGVGSDEVVVAVRPRPVVFIPGLGGSELIATARVDRKPVDNGHGGTYTVDLRERQLIWLDLFQMALPFTDDFFDSLKFSAVNPAPLFPTAPNGRLVPVTSYSAVAPFFEANGYVQGRDLFIFTYDWRYSVEDSAGSLDSFVRGVRASTGAPMVDIVAHSLGGLVARSFLGRGTEAANAEHIVLLGSPLLGTPRGGAAVTHGVCLPGAPDPCLLDPFEVQDVLRTLPSAVQVASSPTYWEIFHGQDEWHPWAYVDLRRTAGVALPPVYETQRALEERRGVTAAIISPAEAFHASDRTWLSGLAPRVTLVGGTGRCTIGQVQDVQRLEPIRIGPLVVGYRLVEAIDAVQIEGDGTVVRQSAVLSDDFVDLDLTHGARVVLIEASHDALAGAPGLRVALTAIRGEMPTSGLPRRPDCGVVSVHSPAELLVIDPQGRRVGSDGTTLYREIPGAAYERVGEAKFVTLHAPASYRVVLRGSADGEATVQYREVSAGTITRHFLYPHVATRAGSIAELTVTSGGAIPPSQLRIDLNADGVTDEIVDARALAGGAPDREGPQLRLTAPLGAQAVVGSALVDWTVEDSGSGVVSSVAVIDGATAPTVITRSGMVAFAPGRHEVALFGEDRAGNGATRTYFVDALTLEWLAPLDKDRERQFSASRAIPVKFVIRRADGTLVADQSVTVELLNGAGHAALPPRRAAAGPEDGVTIADSKYHTNLKTSGLAAGQYTLRVSFTSPTLVGRVDLAVVLR